MRRARPQKPIKAGVIGWPVSHSRSPLIHNHWMAEHGIDAVYDTCPIDPAMDFRAALEALAEAGYVGVNVTIPHKENAFRAMDALSPAAERLGAVNTIGLKDGRMVGSNTDGDGFVASLDVHGTKWRDAPALVLGAGGAARAIIAALHAAGISEIRFTNRTRARAEALVYLAPGAVHIGDWEARHLMAAECGLLVNTTSLGMAGAASLDMRLDNLAAGATVSDIVYTPLETELLARARAQGLVAIDGLGMLMHQAALSFESWFGVAPAVSQGLRAKLITDLQAEATEG